MDRVSAGCRTSAELSQFVEEFANARLSYWAKQLTLSDWHISIVMTERSGLKPRTLGGIRWDKGKKRAQIAVLAPSEYRTSFAEMLNDMEFTLVHELVHLELASLPRSEASRRSEEHAVNRLAEALLKLNRRSDSRKAQIPCGAIER